MSVKLKRPSCRCTVAAVLAADPVQAEIDRLLAEGGAGQPDAALLGTAGALETVLDTLLGTDEHRAARRIAAGQPELILLLRHRVLH